MNGASDKFLAGATFAGDEHRCTGVFEARNHAQNFLNFRRGTDDAVHSGFGIRALAQEFVFLDQANFFRHSAQEKPEFFERRKRLGDVVICAQLHGLHRGLDRTMPGHERNLGAGQKLLYFLQELEPRHVGHDHVGQDHVGGLLLEQGESGIAAVGFKTDEAQSFADGDAELADALLIVHDQQTDAELILTQRRSHSALPIVFAMTSMNCCTRKGFSTQGAPVWRRVATVSSLAMSPVMKTILEAKSGRCWAIQWCTWAPARRPSQPARLRSGARAKGQI